MIFTLFPCLYIWMLEVDKDFCPISMFIGSDVRSGSMTFTLCPSGLCSDAIISVCLSPSVCLFVFSLTQYLIKTSMGGEW